MSSVSRGNHPVAEELLDNLAVGAVFGAATDGFQNAAGHGMLGRQVLDGAVVGQFGKGGVNQSLAAGLDDLAVPGGN